MFICSTTIQQRLQRSRTYLQISARAGSYRACSCDWPGAGPWPAARPRTGAMCTQVSLWIRRRLELPILRARAHCAGPTGRLAVPVHNPGHGACARAPAGPDKCFMAWPRHVRSGPGLLARRSGRYSLLNLLLQIKLSWQVSVDIGAACSDKRQGESNNQFGNLG